MKDLKPYLVEFHKNSAMKPKVYSLDYAVENNKRRPIIRIINGDCTFSAKDGIRKA